MAGLAVSSWDPQAALVVAAVLVEAIALYVGYGALERLVGSRLAAALAGDADAA